MGLWFILPKIEPQIAAYLPLKSAGAAIAEKYESTLSHLGVAPLCVAYPSR